MARQSFSFGNFVTGPESFNEACRKGRGLYTSDRLVPLRDAMAELLASFCVGYCQTSS
jgi:hypothetical protein